MTYSLCELPHTGAADEIDQGALQSELYLQIALLQQRWAAQFELKRIGLCHYCGEPLSQGGLFCDSDCGEDYERHQKLQSRRELFS